MQQIKVNIPHFYNETELCTYLVQGGNGMRTNSRNLDQMERRILAKNKKKRLQEKKQTKKTGLVDRQWSMKQRRLFLHRSQNLIEGLRLTTEGGSR